MQSIVDVSSSKCTERSFSLMPHGSTGITTEVKYSRYSNPDESFWDENVELNANPLYQGENKSVEEILKAAPVGTRIAVKNLMAERGSAWQFENAVKLGDNIYGAHGFGKNNKFSLEQIKKNLAEITYNASGIPLQEYIDKYVYICK